MQLDQTHVAVRVRTLSEIGDLALVLLRRYPTTMLVGFTLGALPWVIINGLLLYWIPIREAAFGLEDSEAFWEIARYGWWMALLVFLETPAAGVITTIYLGQAVFEHQPSWKSATKIARQQALRWVYCLGVRRLAIPALVFAGFRMFEPFDTVLDGLVPMGVFLIAVVVRAGRPYLPEMILLEMCPLRSKDEKEITLARRARALHRPVGSDVGSRWLMVAMMLVVVFAGVFYSLVWIRGITLGYWNMGIDTLLFLYPLALWIVGGLSVIVRMIAYLDTRIRLEGWDVELAIRAEAIRQFGEDMTSVRRPAPAPQPDPNGQPAEASNPIVAGAGR